MMSLNCYEILKPFSLKSELHPLTKLGGGGIREGGYPLEHQFEERVPQLVYTALRGEKVVNDLELQFLLRHFLLRILFSPE